VRRGEGAAVRSPILKNLKPLQPCMTRAKKAGNRRDDCDEEITLRQSMADVASYKVKIMAVAKLGRDMYPI
jgi:hypothetical protein